MESMTRRPSTRRASPLLFSLIPVVVFFLLVFGPNSLETVFVLFCNIVEKCRGKGTKAANTIEVIVELGSLASPASEFDAHLFQRAT